MNTDKYQRFRLHAAVSYRVYDSEVLLYHTGRQKVMSFNESAKDILDCFKQWTSLNEALQKLRKQYKIGDESSFEQMVNKFINELISKNILIPEFHQSRRFDTFEQTISREKNGNKRLNTVTFELTYKCNERCRHCYVVNNNRTELTKEKIFSVLDELAEMNTFHIIFTGGDIFTRKDAFEILEYAHSKDFLIEIFTNGLLLDGDAVVRLKSLWPKCIDFSIYSHIPEKHDAVTQVEGSFKKTISAIKKCVLVGIPVNIKSPIFRETLDDVKAMVKMANELGVTIEPGINITPKKDGGLEPTEMRICTKEEYWKFFDTMTEIYGDIYSNKEYKPSEMLCNAGENSITINPYGEVFPCNLMPLCVGNVLENSVKEIWEKSETLLNWRKMNDRSLCKDCTSCSIKSSCNFCPGDALLREGHLHSKYETACVDADWFEQYKKRKEV